jgi:hypothetical protein
MSSWRCIWSSSFAHTIPAIRADELQFKCVFLVNLIKRRQGLADRVPVRRVRSFLCGFVFISNWVSAMPGRQIRGSKKAPVKKVLNVRKFQDTPLIPAHNGTQGSSYVMSIPSTTPWDIFDVLWDTLWYTAIAADTNQRPSRWLFQTWTPVSRRV